MPKELLIFRNYDESTAPVGKLVLFDETTVDVDDVIAFGIELPTLTFVDADNFTTEGEPKIISAALITGKKIDKRTWREKLANVAE